ncbi:MAG: ABC transporter substrate-binding protein [Desulfobacteraceae bacterium]|nr:ABC transporter substrate-binding protein [Desulfobacteraceae bacterium]
MGLKTKRALLVSGIFVFSATFALLSIASMAAAKPLSPIKIGIVQSVSGMVSDFALEDLEGFRVKIDEVNAMGGVDTKDGKRQIELIVRDNKLKPDIAVKNAKSLILEEKVDFLVGCISSSCALAVSEVAKENKTLFWVWDARTHHLTGARGHRYVFRSTGNTWMNGHAAANYFKDKPYTRYALINPDYSYGRSQYDAFVQGMKSVKPDFKLVSEQWPKLGTTDFTPYITALLSAKPEVVYTSMWGTDAMTFIKQAKGYGFFKKIKYVGLFHGMPLLRPMGQEMVEDIYVLTECPFVYPGTPENKAFYDAYKARTGKFPSSYSIGGYNAATFIVAGIEKAGTVENEALIDALEGITIKTIAPAKEITIRKYDHQSDYGITIGKTVKDPNWPWFVLKDVVIIPGASTMRTIDQIMTERAAKNK